MSKYDLESLLVDIQTLMSDNLNTYISAVNTDKSDSITLATVNSGAYFMQSMGSAQANYDPYVFFGVIEIRESDNLPSLVPMNAVIEVVIVVQDEGADLNITKRMLRYGRALKELFEEKFDSLDNGVKLRVQSLVPIDLSFLNDSRPQHAIGVRLVADMG